NARIYECVELVVKAKAADGDLLAALKPGIAAVLDSMADPAAGPGKALLKKACAYLDAHLGEKLSLGRVAAELGVSPAFFSKAFKNEAGSGFSRYLSMRRVDEASRWLSQS